MHHTFLILISPLFTNGLSSALMAHAAQMKAFSMWICGTRGMGGFVPAGGAGPSSLGPLPPLPPLLKQNPGGGDDADFKNPIDPYLIPISEYGVCLHGCLANRPTGQQANRP